MAVKVRELQLPHAGAIASALGVAVVVRACDLASDVIGAPDWRSHEKALSRSALRTVLEALGENTDTARLEPVRGRFSISHSGDWSVAAGVAKGRVGIDLETRPILPAQSARFFLNEIEASSGIPEDLPRLWAIKEAAFKADPSNEGRILRDYRLLLPEAEIGIVHIDNNVIQYACWHVGAGYLALAYSGDQP